MTHLRIEQNNIPEQVNATIIRKLHEVALSVPEPNVGEEDAAYLAGTLQTAYAYRSDVDYLTDRFTDLYINVITDYYVEFEDPIIKQYCASHYGDGVGVTENAVYSVIPDTNDLTIKFWGTRYGNEMTSELKSQVTTLNDFQYFTNPNMDYSLIYGFSNATSIKFPNKTFVYTNAYQNTIVDESYNLQTIDYNDAIFTVTNNGTLILISRNDVIENWDSSLLPKQNSYDHILLFYTWKKLKKVLFPEGKTHFFDYWKGCQALQYVEYPSTTVSMGNGYGLGRDSGHRLPCMVVKAVNPPIWDGWDSTDTTGQSGVGLGWVQLPVAIYVPDNSVTAYTSVTNNGTNNESLWANPAISSLVKPMSEIPQIYLDMGTVTQADINRV